MTCPDCGSDAGFEAERIEAPGPTARMTTVTYCANCGEVASAAP